MKQKLRLLILGSFVFFFASAVQASYEKPMLWSGRYSSVGGAAASAVRGAESLYFNPAGLAKIHKLEFNLNASPMWLRASAPVVYDNTHISSPYSFGMPTSFFIAYSPLERLGIGIGMYAAAGAGFTFGNVGFGSVAEGYMSGTEVRGITATTEYSLGAAYEVIKGLRFGASWRISYASSDTFTGSRVLAMTSSVEGQKGSDYKGFRLGAQYQNEADTWGVGLAFRSEVPWDLKGGKHTLSSLRTNPPREIIQTYDAETALIFPWQIGLAGHYKVRDDLELLLQYEFTNYASTKEVVLKSTALTRVLGLPGGKLATQVNFRNLHSIRAGLEFTRFLWPLRMGYIHQSSFSSWGGPATVAKDRASFTTTPPGAIHTILLGTGRNIIKGLEADISFDYTFVSGLGDKTALGNLAGEYSTTFLSVHTGLTYRL